MKKLIFFLLVIPTMLLSQITPKDIDYTDYVRQQFRDHASSFSKLSAFETDLDKQAAYYYSIMANNAFLHTDYLNVLFSLTALLKDKRDKKGLDAMIKKRLEQVLENLDQNLKTLPDIKSDILADQASLFEADLLALKIRLEAIHDRL